MKPNPALAVLLMLAAPAASAQEIGGACMGNALESCVFTVSGPIEPGLTDRFEAEFGEGLAEAFRVLIDSPGGDAAEAMRFGRFIRGHGFRTETGRLPGSRPDPYFYDEILPGTCAGACVLAFLGGGSRLAAPEALELSPLVTGETDPVAVQREAGAILRYLDEMGATSELFALAAESAPLDAASLVSTGLVTPRSFGDWALVPMEGGIAARTARLVPTQPYDLVREAALFCRTGQGPALVLTAEAVDIVSIADDLMPVPAFVSIQDIHGYTIFETEILLRAENGRSDGETQWIDIPLPRAASGPLAAAGRLFVRLSVPRAAGGYFAELDIGPDAQPLVAAALRPCT